jgi:hypothetical protein
LAGKGSGDAMPSGKSNENRKIGISIYIKTLIISIAIFSLGLLIGAYIENFFVSDLSARTTAMENSVSEIELEMLYFQELPTVESCNFLNAIVRKTNSNLDTLAQDLVRYSDKSILFTTEDVRNIKTTYTSLLIKDWLFQGKISKTCGTSAVTVLYFYSAEGCDDCITQGNVLTLLKETFKDKLMVFPIDTEIELSMIDILKERFGATSTPNLVIGGKTYKRIVGLAELKNLICAELPQIEECKSQ